MSETFDDFKSKLDQILGQLPAIAASIAAQGQRISDLQAQLAAGTPVTQEQLDQLGEEADAIEAGVQALIPAAPPVHPPPTT